MGNRKEKVLTIRKAYYGLNQKEKVELYLQYAKLHAHNK
jgi:hypothetical protein